MLRTTEGLNVNPGLVIHIVFQSFSNPMIHHMDYPSQGLTQLKYSDASTPEMQRGQSNLDPHTNYHKYLIVSRNLSSLN